MPPELIALPELNAVDKRVRKLPADCARWLLDLSGYPTTPEGITALEISDDEFGMVVMTPGSWRIVQRALNVYRLDRYRALFHDQGAPELEVSNAH